jgi:hypothetical protein
MKIFIWKYHRKKKKSSVLLQLLKSSKDFVQQQSKVWDHGRLQATTIQQLDSKVNEQ